MVDRMKLDFFQLAVFFLLTSGVIIGVQVFNASKVDWDEFSRSWQTIIGVLLALVGVFSMKHKKE